MVVELLINAYLQRFKNSAWPFSFETYDTVHVRTIGGIPPKQAEFRLFLQLKIGRIPPVFAELKIGGIPPISRTREVDVS